MREDRGWSQSELSRRCGLGFRLIGAMERGNENFRLSSLLEILKCLEITVAELFRWIE
jgi:transcriptional regulator with XRE-family HTH domain